MSLWTTDSPPAGVPPHSAENGKNAILPHSQERRDQEEMRRTLPNVWQQNSGHVPRRTSFVIPLDTERNIFGKSLLGQN